MTTVTLKYGNYKLKPFHLDNLPQADEHIRFDDITLRVYHIIHGYEQPTEIVTFSGGQGTKTTEKYLKTLWRMNLLDEPSLKLFEHEYKHLIQKADSKFENLITAVHDSQL